METIFVKMQNSKANEPHKFVLNLSQRLDLRSSDKHFELQRNCRNYKLKTIAPTWNDEFELPNGFYSVSDIQDYVEFIIKKHETLTTILPIHVYINRINNRFPASTRHPGDVS